jgi:CRISPR-associated exonuclease Cas4
MSVLLTPSEIIAYLYCPRFIYFMFCLALKEHEEKRFKVQKGRHIHEEKTRINKDYLRKRIGATAKDTEVYLSSEKLHLRGIADEVLTLKDGSMAPLDYKFAVYKQRNYKTLKTQSLAYGLLIAENYNTPVHKGFIVYTRSRNKLVEIEFTPKDYAGLKATIRDMLLIIQKGWHPKKTSSKAKCVDCAYKNICV